MSTKRKRTKDVKIAREVKNAMGVLTDIPFKVMSEALYRTGLIYPIIAETPGIGLEPTAAKDTPATWSTTFHCHYNTIWTGSTVHRYRICNSSKSEAHVSIYVDGKEQDEALFPGSCRDVEGKEIKVHMPAESKASGTYDNLD